LFVSERHNLVPGPPVHRHAGVPWKTRSNSCSAPAGASNRAKYWRSFLIYLVAGLLAAVILFTAARTAAPLFIIMVVLVLIPLAALGILHHHGAVHDRDKSAWWLLVFCGLPAVLGQFAKAAWFAEPAGTVLHSILALAGFALTIWGFVEIGCLRGTVGSNTYGPDPLTRAKRPG
jgi:uncharacterized membrane protein YhaH (DUF805 family)